MKRRIFIIIVFFFLGCSRRAVTNLTLHAGAGLRDAVAPLVQLFEKENPNIKINVNYGGSGRLLGQITAGNLDGLFMPGDSFYVEQAIKQGVAVESSKRVIAYFVPVIFVQKNNPMKILSLKDFLNNNLRIGIADARSAAIGRRSLEIFKKNNIPFDKIKKQIAVETGTVNELGVAISTKTVDAAIIWDATARQFSDYGEIVFIPESKNIISEIPIILLKSTKDKKSAAKFINFCVSKKGSEIFRKKGYTINSHYEK